jgi:hypothetical protein
MRIVAWAYFNSPEEKKKLYGLVERCSSYPELYLELSKLYPTEEMLLIHMLAQRLIEEKSKKK